MSIGQPGTPGIPGSINQKPNYQSVKPSPPGPYPSSSYPGSPGIVN